MAKKKQPATVTNADEPVVDEPDLEPFQEPEVTTPLEDELDRLETENGDSYIINYASENLEDPHDWVVCTNGPLPDPAGQLRVRVIIAGQVYSAIAAPREEPTYGLTWQGLTPLQWKPFTKEDTRNNE